jgi:hypothetical protein
LILTEEDASTTEIRYKVTIRFIKPQTPTSALLSIDRAADVYMDDRPVDRLAYETGRVFYPLLVEMDTRMKWLGIRNQEQIIRRWETILPDVRRYFKGEEAARYLNRMSEALASKEKLEEIFDKELLFQLYFGALYANQAASPEDEVEFSFSAGDYAPVRFVIENQIPAPGKNGTVEVKQNGTEQEQKVRPDAGQDEKNAYSAHFVLNDRTNIIREIVAGWNFRTPVQRQVKVILFPLRQAVPGISFIEEKEVREKKKSKGFFSRLFGE